MAAFIVSYDLRKPQRNYSPLYERLDEWGALSLLESVFIVNAAPHVTSADIRADIANYVDGNDGLFVAKLTGEAAWRFLLCDSEDLKARLRD